ncbi:MAG: L-threonylcarbamoyladenylate synthase [Usitatibacter sp.]
MSSPEEEIAAAARRLARGEIVAFPTETVYGLGANAADPAAVARIFALKGRPTEHPLIVHLERAGDLDCWAIDIPDAARELADSFWPGALTMILRKAPHVLMQVTGGQDSVGLRVPGALANKLLAAFNRLGERGGIAAPSANRFGHVSPTTAQHVRDEFGPDLPLLDGGRCEIGLESTIVDFSRGEPVLLRPGGISRARIEQVLGAALSQDMAGAPRVSGSLATHYAPRTALTLVDRATIAEELKDSGVAVLALGHEPAHATVRAWIAGSNDPMSYAHDLYANLRTLDASGARRILVEAPPKAPEWEAVNDRLARAAAGAGDLRDEP